jgi:hypothetical protein
MNGNPFRYSLPLVLHHRAVYDAPTFLTGNANRQLGTKLGTRTEPQQIILSPTNRTNVE